MSNQARPHVVHHPLHFTRRAALKTLGAGAATLALPAWAAWPDKPIKIIVTFPPGGSSDVMARIMAEQLTKKLGQSVVVDNKPGAGGTIGGAAVAQAPADGYTFMLSNTTPIALGPFTLDKLPYDPVEAFTHAAYLGSAPLVVMANPGVPIRPCRTWKRRRASWGGWTLAPAGRARLGTFMAS